MIETDEEDVQPLSVLLTENGEKNDTEKVTTNSDDDDFDKVVYQSDRRRLTDDSVILVRPTTYGRHRQLMTWFTRHRSGNLQEKPTNCGTNAADVLGKFLSGKL